MQFVDDIELVCRFDKARLAARSTKVVRVQQQYMHIATIVKQKLSDKFTHFTSEIAEWQRAFRQEHGSFPSPSDIPEHLAKIMLSRRTVKKIVFHEWKQVLK